MTGPDISKSSGGSDGDAEYGDAAGGVTTATHSSDYSAATAFSDDSPNSPYGTPAKGSAACASSSEQNQRSGLVRPG